MNRPLSLALAAITSSAAVAGAHADLVQVRVTVRNLAPTNSVSFAPLRVGFHNGTYDPFNSGETPTPAIISVAEGGGGSAFFPAFMAAQPSAVLGSVLPMPPGPLLPGATGTAVFTVDSRDNRFFTFASMVVPSNDYFIGNDSPVEYEIFDSNGKFVPTFINERGADIWDAGSEIDGTFGAAFLMGSSNDDHLDENGVVGFDFADLSIFNGGTTAAGYVFDSQLTAKTTVYSITIEEVPPVKVRVTIENLAPVNSVSFAPLRVAFSQGIYDSFNEGEIASPAIISIAEGGSGSAFFPAFMAAEPAAVLGTILPNPAGPLLPGGTGVADFTLNPATNRYFTFGSMVVPSNDYFIGNDSPTEYLILDANGEVIPTTILERATDIWDAGSELDGIFGAAFLMGSSNDDHLDENGVVGFDFADLSIFNGSTTAVGYVFDSQLTSRTDVYRITIAAAPACDGDLSGNGAVGPEDLAILLGAWGGKGSEDIDGDGVVGATDLALLLGAWGSCP